MSMLVYTPEEHLAYLSKTENPRRDLVVKMPQEVYPPSLRIRTDPKQRACVTDKDRIAWEKMHDAGLTMLDISFLTGWHENTVQRNLACTYKPV